MRPEPRTPTRIELSDFLEEFENALPDQPRAFLVVVGRAPVREQVAIPRIEEELGPRDRLGDLLRDVDVPPVVVLHGVDLERNTGGPRASVVLQRNAAVEEKRTARAGAGHGELLRWHRPEREAGVHDVRGELIRGADAAVGNRVEPGPVGVGYALVQLGEGLAVIQIWRMDGVPRGAQLVGERPHAGREPQCVVEQEDRRHGWSLPRRMGVRYWSN